MVGTPFMPKTRDMILFAEDVEEHTLRLDSLFQHLKYADMLQAVQGVALGEFLKCDDVTQHGKTIPELLQEAMPGFKGPIVEGLPFGHADHYCAIPIGARAKLSAHNGQVKLELLQRVVENSHS
jgi:muramoyltetrapeptide carboxypeptidase